MNIDSIERRTRACQHRHTVYIRDMGHGKSQHNHAFRIIELRCLDCRRKLTKREG